MTRLFSSHGQSIGASAPILPTNSHSLFSLGLTGLTSLLSKGLSTPQFESISSSAPSLLYGRTLTSIHDYRNNHNFDYMVLCQQSDGPLSFWNMLSRFFTCTLEDLKIQREPLTSFKRRWIKFRLSMSV